MFFITLYHDVIVQWSEFLFFAVDFVLMPSMTHHVSKNLD